MIHLPKPKLTLHEQYNLDNKSYTFKQFADQQLAKMQHRYFAADFECTTKEPYTVYMVTIEDINTGEQWFYHSIDEFLMFCEMYPNSTIYFHNGENYDYEFIINKVLRDDNDWRLSQSKGISIKKTLDEYEVTKTGRTLRKQNGQHIKIEAYIQFKDTTNIFTTSLKALGNSIGLTKGYGEIDTPLVAYINANHTWVEQSKYNTKRFAYHDTNYKVDFITNGWWFYAMQDTHVLAEVIRHYGLIEHSEKDENTAAKIAYNEMLYTNVNYHNYVKDLKRIMYESENYKDFIIQLNKFAKQAYKGGIAWSNPLYPYLIELSQSVGYHLDYNSMYPSIYMQPKLYPLPMNKSCKEKTDLYIVKYKKLSAQCNDNAFPLIKNRTEDINGNAIKSSSATYYLRTVIEDEISLTSVEDKYLKENYHNIKFEAAAYVYYEEHHSLESALVNHGNKWYKEKQEGSRLKDDARKMYAKMMLNTVYGYLGFFNKIVATYDYTLTDNGTTNKQIRDDIANSKKAVLGLNHAEVPAAAFITAYGRVKLANDINKIGIENVVCCDTDSLFVINKDIEELKELVNIDSVELGALDKEHEFSKIRAIKAKTWCISDDLELARTDPDEYAKANPYKPIAQATAGSNYKFKDIRHFKPGATFLSTEKLVGVGGVGIHKIAKELGEITSLQLSHG